MSGRLGDDGTLDTVVVCEHCGEEARYNYPDDIERDTPEDATDDDREALYSSWVKSCIEDFDETHICSEELADEDDENGGGLS